MIIMLLDISMDWFCCALYALQRIILYMALIMMMVSRRFCFVCSF